MQRLTWRLIPVMFVAVAIRGQVPAPVVKHLLHAGKLPRVSDLHLTLHAAAPEALLGTGVDGQTIFALIPQEDRRWTLNMLSGWDTSTLNEQSLTFDGNDSRDRQDYVSGGMTPTPDGKYLLVRILVFHLATLKRDVVVLLVDLKTFRVLWRRVSDDPLLANSRLRFSDEGTLIAAEGPDTSEGGKRLVVMPEVLTMDPYAIGEHTAAVLSFPELTPSLQCRYVVSSGVFESTSGHDAVLEGDSCAELLKFADVAAATELPGPSDGKRHIANLAGGDCDLVTLSREKKLALYDCRSGYALGKDAYITKARSVRVLTVADGADGLSIPIPVRQVVSSTLAKANGRDYVIMLLNGLHLEAYLIP